MSTKNHYRKKDNEQMLNTMNDQWDALVAASLDKHRKMPAKSRTRHWLDTQEESRLIDESNRRRQ